MIKLSILVPTVPSRIELFYVKLMKELLRQIEPYKNDIELIAFFDNKKRSIGKKRQEMINLSQGEYIVFIDDDDRISENYISEIMIKLYENPDADCVVFDSICRLDGGIEKLCKYGIEFEYGYINDGLEWRGKPAHTMVYASNIVKRHEYTDMGCGEDFNWVKRAYLDIKNQIRIDKILYYYDSEGSTLSEMSGISDEVILENVNKRLNKIE
jgi:glycosyltransferase involved in cell wall biosynthesis